MDFFERELKNVSHKKDEIFSSPALHRINSNRDKICQHWEFS